ncbi:MAG: type III secretion protein [Micrococcales bacterium 70-64]|nr:EscU/YscU/HrcU family type III secretion system export apparatus switch protein [Leifsonia sp.]ODU64099.1 MAG: type III secretion protein [Leifsonia sp. SCN 70-46]OJX85789.1 MAG: type III secretion protein [Micrococcales bacterium 70-64]
MSDSGERTEQATQKRMKEVRQKGQLQHSKDLVAWVAVGAAAAMIPGLIASAKDTGAAAVLGFRDIIAHPDPEAAVAALRSGMGSIIPALTPMFVVVIIAVVAASAVQGGIHFKRPAPRFDQFEPVAGLKRIFGFQALWEGAKALLKTVVVGLVLFSVLQGLMPVLSVAGGLPISNLLAETTGSVVSVLQAAIIAGLALAAVDLLVVMRRNRKSTRMTKREVKDENKNAEGDPMIRAMRRSRQLAMGRNRMIAAVTGADVVLLNPTHIAVALKYEPGKSAPRVVAKGADAVALKIREKAAQNDIPMVEDIALARALHAACEIGQEIPAELYTAVARVLAFVMSLKARGAAKGTHKLTTQTA